MVSNYAKPVILWDDGPLKRVFPSRERDLLRLNNLLRMSRHYRSPSRGGLRGLLPNAEMFERCIAFDKPLETQTLFTATYRYLMRSQGFYYVISEAWTPTTFNLVVHRIEQSRMLHEISKPLLDNVLTGRGLKRSLVADLTVILLRKTMRKFGYDQLEAWATRSPRERCA